MRVLNAILIALVVVTMASLASAHELEFTYTNVVLRPDGTFHADVTCDLDALALGVAPSVDSEQVVRRLRSLPPDDFDERVERVRDTMASHVHLRFDGARVPIVPTFPEHGNTEGARIPTILGLTARFEGVIPDGAKQLTVRVEGVFPPMYLTVIDEAADIVDHQTVSRGAASYPFFLDSEARKPRGVLAVLRSYVRLGFTHIVPRGADHILFVVGLFLLTAAFKPLLIQVTAFTVAHTVTLALSSYGVFRLSPSIVEPLIALSIAYVAIENLVTRELKPWRPVVVFGFGLLHGLGFAGALDDLKVPPSEALGALVGFNLGVELGQIAVLAIAFLTIGRFSGAPWYRARVTIPLSVVIAVAGMLWASQRLYSLGPW